jgi:uncharacterized membrane protein
MSQKSQQNLMANPSPQNLRIISIMFLVAGAWGLLMGMFYFKNPSFPLTALGVINLVLGIFLGFRQLRKGDNTKIRKKEK